MRQRDGYRQTIPLTSRSFSAPIEDLLLSQLMKIEISSASRTLPATSYGFSNPCGLDVLAPMR